jgi:hypothetical protein
MVTQVSYTISRMLSNSCGPGLITELTTAIHSSIQLVKVFEVVRFEALEPWPFIHQWLYSALLGPGLFFRFVISSTKTVGLLGRVISPSQGHYLHAEQHKHRINANIHASSGIRTHDPSFRASKDSLCLSVSTVIDGPWFYCSILGDVTPSGRIIVTLYPEDGGSVSPKRRQTSTRLYDVTSQEILLLYKSVFFDQI